VLDSVEQDQQNKPDNGSESRMIVRYIIFRGATKNHQ
jgi:hypothetical protein